MLSWSRLGESNPGPTHYECVALPSELRRLVRRAGWLGTIAHYIEPAKRMTKSKWARSDQHRVPSRGT